MAEGRAARRSGARAGDAEQLSRADRVARGKDARAVAPLGSQAEFVPDGSRDPVGLLLGQDRSRGCRSWCRSGMGGCWCRRSRSIGGGAADGGGSGRHAGRRGCGCSCAGMRTCPISGRSRRRSGSLVFDVNDFDETLPGPFEWDVKRLAASLSVAGRDNGFPAKDRRKMVLAAAEGYRTAMREFAQQSLMGVWYAHLDIEQAIGQFRSQIKAKRFKAGQKMLAKAHTRDSMQALDKLTTVVDGRRRIIADPPMIVPIEEVFADVQADALYKQLRAVLGKYQRSLQSDRRHLLGQFAMVQVARKVVGVGSVGTRAWIVLMEAGDGIEPLFLQAKEAQPSVLAEYCGRSQYKQRRRAGRRRAAPDAGPKRHLPRLDPRHRRGRGGARLLRPPAAGLEILHAHRTNGAGRADRLRPGLRLDPRPGARPLRRPGRPGRLPRRLHQIRPGHRRRLAETYADQNERDYAALQAAVKDGKAQTTTDI
mgnify:CR=1 FL=1